MHIPFDLQIIIFLFVGINVFNVINHSNPSILFMGKAFAENSSSTSLQRVALRRVVSLSSGYFLQWHYQKQPKTEKALM